MAPTLPRPGIITGASNIYKGSTIEQVTINSSGLVSFSGTVTGGYLTSITITSGTFLKLNGETVTLKGTLALAAPGFSVSDSVPSSSLVVSVASGGNGLLTQATGSTDLTPTIMGSQLTVASGSLFINDFTNPNGHATNITLVVTTAQCSDSSSSFCATTYTETMNTSLLNIPAFNNNSITMGGLNMMTCITSSTDLPSFYTTQAVMVVVKNTNLTSSINVTIYNNSTSDGLHDIYYFGNNVDTIAAGHSMVYLQLATGIFTQLFGN